MSLDCRITALISIGVSVGANCQPCLEYHVTKARESGISEEEIGEAINVGRMVRDGAAYRMEHFIAGLQAKGVSDQQPADKAADAGAAMPVVNSFRLLPHCVKLNTKERMGAY